MTVATQQGLPELHVNGDAPQVPFTDSWNTKSMMPDAPSAPTAPPVNENVPRDTNPGYAVGLTTEGTAIVPRAALDAAERHHQETSSQGGAEAANSSILQTYPLGVPKLNLNSSSGMPAATTMGGPTDDDHSPFAKAERTDPEMASSVLEPDKRAYAPGKPLDPAQQTQGEFQNPVGSLLAAASSPSSEQAIMPGGLKGDEVQTELNQAFRSAEPQILAARLEALTNPPPAGATSSSIIVESELEPTLEDLAQLKPPSGEITQVLTTVGSAPPHPMPMLGPSASAVKRFVADTAVEQKKPIERITEPLPRPWYHPLHLLIMLIGITCVATCFFQVLKRVMPPLPNGQTVVAQARHSRPTSIGQRMVRAQTIDTPNCRPLSSFASESAAVSAGYRFMSLIGDQDAGPNTRMCRTQEDALTFLRPSP